MKNILKIMIGVAPLLISCGNNAKQLGNADINKIVDAMTMEEKLHIVIGDQLEVKTNGNAVIGTSEKIVPGAAGNTYNVKRLGITSAVLADGPAGLRIDSTRKNETRTYYCTHFPIGTLLASTWNIPLVEEVGRCIGDEAKEYGVDVLLAPAINIQRNPLCGRNFEYYSEDPILAGKIGAAYIRGVQSNGIGTSLKHFAVNNQETNRQNVDVRISQRALREIYLKGFEIAVKEAHPWTIMSSYNYINGIYASQNYDLLTTLLRKEWGFKGMVMTDWYGGKDAVEQMNAGNDLLMPGRKEQYNQLKNALANGTLKRHGLDKNIKRILQVVEKTPRFKDYHYSNNPNLKAHATVTRQSATEGMVLFKNNGALPLANNIRNVALLGCTSYQFISGGTGSGNVNRAYTISLLDGLRKTGMNTDATLQHRYEKYIADENLHAKKPTGPFARFLSKPLPKEMIISDTNMNYLAKTKDIAIISLGRISGEFVDRKKSDFLLSKEEKELITKTSEAFHKQGKKVIVLLNIGGVIETTSWKAIPDAILCAWQGGQEGGNSVADIITGKVCPSGKLPMTFPINYEDDASSSNFPKDASMINFNINGKNNRETTIKNIDYTNYDEDIYVGYRYFDSFNKHVSYPFGYGLSYTKFDYSNAHVILNGNLITVTVEIKNTGKTMGKEVVELYTMAPNQVKLNKPTKELKAFIKTKELKPNEIVTVKLRFKKNDLASYDDVASGWRVDAGNYKLLIGSSSQDIRQIVNIDVKNSFVKCNDVLKPDFTLDKLKRHS